jgi:hypothetical protein
MQCPKCNHPINDTSTQCMYCGAPTAGSTLLPGSSGASDASGGVHVRQSGPFKMEDDPARKNLQKENGVCSNGYEIVIEQTEELSSTQATNPHIDALSPEKTAAMLAKMKNLLDSGRFDANVYEHMALDAVKDYLSTMNDSARLIFVSYEIQDSDLGPFLTQAMMETLRMYVMDAIAQR